MSEQARWPHDRRERSPANAACAWSWTFMIGRWARRPAGRSAPCASGTPGPPGRRGAGRSAPADRSSRKRHPCRAPRRSFFVVSSANQLRDATSSPACARVAWNGVLSPALLVLHGCTRGTISDRAPRAAVPRPKAHVSGTGAEAVARRVGAEATSRRLRSRRGRTRVVQQTAQLEGGVGIEGQQRRAPPARCCRRRARRRS